PTAPFQERKKETISSTILEEARFLQPRYNWSKNGLGSRFAVWRLIDYESAETFVIEPDTALKGDFPNDGLQPFRRFLDVGRRYREDSSDVIDCQAELNER